MKTGAFDQHFPNHLHTHTYLTFPVRTILRLGITNQPDPNSFTSCIQQLIVSQTVFTQYNTKHQVRKREMMAVHNRQATQTQDMRPCQPASREAILSTIVQRKRTLFAGRVSDRSAQELCCNNESAIFHSRTLWLTSIPHHCQSNHRMSWPRRHLPPFPSEMMENCWSF